MIKKVLEYNFFGPSKIEEDDGTIWEVNHKTQCFEKIVVTEKSKEDK